MWLIFQYSLPKNSSKVVHLLRLGNAAAGEAFWFSRPAFVLPITLEWFKNGTFVLYTEHGITANGKHAYLESNQVS